MALLSYYNDRFVTNNLCVSILRSTLLIILPGSVTGHLFRGTHDLVLSLMTCPAGQLHPGRHTAIQIGFGF